MMVKARYAIEQRHPLIIRDLGPWQLCPTITNDAEAVVAELVAQEIAPWNGEIMYYDSEGELDKLIVKDGRFAGFAPGPPR